MKIIICIALALGTAAIYWPVHRYDFVNYDDVEYVVENAHVRAGLTIDGAKWAFTTGHASNWHPLTWLSHMADVQFFGLNPGAHHVVNLLFHVSNVLLLFLVLARMTRALWPSAAVAALFAWHPLHVESVAWIAERKDVLSTFFGLLSLWAYVRYAESNRRKYLMLALLWLALGLTAKPMLVTLPFVFLLLDYWPLKRIFPSSQRKGGRAIKKMVPFRKGADGGRSPRKPDRAQPSREAVAHELGCGVSDHPVCGASVASRLFVDAAATPPLQGGEYGQLIIQKLPFFALSAASSVVTYAVQRNGGAVAPFENIPMRYRMMNGLLAYAAYLRRTFLPTNLAVIYPIPPAFLWWQVAAAGTLLAAISIAALIWAGRRPWLLVGWLWFLGMLVPVIGFVQVGSQAMADRYTYLPLVGISIMLAWSGAEIAASSRFASRGVAAVTILALSAGMVLAWIQVRTWSDSQTLFQHAINVTKDNYIAHSILGRALAKAGRMGEAQTQFEEALRILPGLPDAHFSLGVILAQKGRFNEAIAHYTRAIEVKPEAATHYNLGNLLMRLGRLDEAITHFAEAVRLDPHMADAENNWGLVLATQGRLHEAIEHYAAALRIKPDLVEARLNVARVREQLAASQ